MKRDLAVKFAAIAIEGTTVDQAERMIGEFLAQIVRCPTCEGDGTITFGRDVVFPTTRGYANEIPEDRRIPAGTIGTCPRCGGEPGTYDPEFVAWRCIRDQSAAECERNRASEAAGNREAHAKCGWRIMLPLEGIDE